MTDDPERSEAIVEPEPGLSQPTPTPDDPQDVDELMRRIDEEITFGSGIVPPKYIEAVVQYQRQQRARREAGIKVRKDESNGPRLDIKELLGRTVKMTRRV